MKEFSRKNVNNEKSQFGNIFLHMSIKCKDWLHEFVFTNQLIYIAFLVPPV